MLRSCYCNDTDREWQILNWRTNLELMHIHKYVCAYAFIIADVNVELY